jgi:hypothetical protein
MSGEGGAGSKRKKSSRSERMAVEEVEVVMEGDELETIADHAGHTETLDDASTDDEKDAPPSVSASSSASAAPASSSPPDPSKLPYAMSYRLHTHTHTHSHTLSQRTFSLAVLACCRLRSLSAVIPRPVNETNSSTQASLAELKKKIESVKEDINAEKAKITASFGDLHQMSFAQLTMTHLELKLKIQALEQEAEAKIKAKLAAKRR